MSLPSFAFTGSRHRDDLRPSDRLWPTAVRPDWHLRSLLSDESTSDVCHSGCRAPDVAWASWAL